LRSIPLTSLRTIAVVLVLAVLTTIVAAVLLPRTVPATAGASSADEPTRLTRPALRTALIPMATYFAFALATLFTGAAITERVYGWHGMGEYSISAISGMDINGVTAVVAFSGLCTLTGALLSDVFVAIVDPRVRVS